MDPGQRHLLLPAALLVLVVILGAPAHAEPIGDPVPVPTGVATAAVSAGHAYPFPWTGVATCGHPFQPGCFVVRQVGPTEVVLAYPRVELQGGAVKPQGFRYVTPITAGGSGYELFVIKHGAGREEWVYAVVDRTDGERAVVRFLKLPAFVTDRARLAVRITLDQARRRLDEHYTVETEESLTLLGLGRVDRVFPGGRIDAVEVNGKRVRFPHPDIVHLNLPAGRHEVAVAVSLGPTDELAIQGPLLEPRRMALIQALDLRVTRPPAAGGAELEVRTVGLPQEVWERFKATLVLAPPPAAETAEALLVRYRFGPGQTITLRGRPRIPVGPNNYPVIITVTSLRR